VQFVIFLVLKDFVEWCIHNLLHRVPWLWEFHKLHHSILELDWIGNMRFHWMEVVVYKSLSYLPLIVLGVDERVILWVAVAGTLIGHLNHSNLAISWGPLRYLINSPRMHVWHHDIIFRGDHGKNFGIVFSVWDWLFGTAFMPSQGQPEQLGFDGMERYPSGVVGRFFYPLTRLLTSYRR
jgi:sterol desaturase/sphingolipid hydroxylase (fatty acid hydroxylase superfamily)